MKGISRRGSHRRRSRVIGCCCFILCYISDLISYLLVVSGNPHRRSLRTCSVVRTLRRGIIVYTYIEYQSVCPCVGIRSSPSLPRKRVCLPPWTQWGGGSKTRLRLWRWGTRFGRLNTLYTLWFTPKITSGR